MRDGFQRKKEVQGLDALRGCLRGVGEEGGRRTRRDEGKSVLRKRDQG